MPQVLFLLYHYFNAKEIYNAIRVFIAAYVWMTGFGALAAGPGSCRDGWLVAGWAWVGETLGRVLLLSARSRNKSAQPGQASGRARVP